MEHLAIMRKSWGFTQKILDGRKKIESRWYLAKRSPWNRIMEGEVIYFKDSGEPVKLKAKVGNVLQFAGLTPIRVKKILEKYGQDLGLEKGEIKEFFERVKYNKYCIFVFLKNPKNIAPFEIDKAGFCAMSAWITVQDINQIKK